MHDRDGVVPFLLFVFVGHQAFAVAVAAHVRAQAGIAVARQIGMRQLIARNRAVALAIGQMFKDQRHGIFVGIFRQPEPRRERDTIGHVDADIVVHLDGAGEVGNGFHGIDRGTGQRAGKGALPLAAGAAHPRIFGPKRRGR